MEKKRFLDYLKEQDFSGLFNEAGWDNPSTSRPLEIEIGSEESRRSYTFREVANLFARVYVCEVEKLPETSERHALDVRLKRNGESYIAIYVLRTDPSCQCWVAPVDAVDRRHLVSILNNHGSQSDFLYEKIQRLTFPLEPKPTSIGVLERLSQTFSVNATAVTKAFYKVFRKHHADFVKKLKGLMGNTDAEWYASVMLNRLMFCYFLQKKGFLDEDQDYLLHHLKETQRHHGKDKFYESFYKHFLRRLFQEGLNAKEHSVTFEDEFGRIPYLNGGMFECHALERKYPDLDLPDSLFESLFKFFDQWEWHLDTSVSASGRDINPDVLGYIFEQYINGRSSMGAYYTKEDITEYISRNTIVPWLLEETAKKSPAAFGKNGFVWTTLRESVDDFIFPAVRKGMEFELPPEIERGVDTTKPDLIARRAEWNTPADANYALPTEIWRETVARRQRCQEIRNKISSGTIHSVNDLITLNLNIRAFAQTLLERTNDPLFVRHFFDALTHVTILDPTCGSGAFLFAALNILEPLYETCLAKMEQWPERFKEELAVLRKNFKGNTRHYIYKTIILNNLYGVDIMHEATEIAKLRLFLKIVAAVDVDPDDENLGLDPLPDIDFNIRCGNTLVGYANPQSVKDDLIGDGLALDKEKYQEIERQAEDVAQLYKRFRSMQAQESTDTTYHDAKRNLQVHLDTLNATLDRTLAQVHHNLGPGIVDYKRRFAEWKAATRPFHWFSEFYAITVARGGFDIIIGNPPYVSTNDVSYPLVNKNNYPDIYALVFERCMELHTSDGYCGLIVPISITFSRDFAALRGKLLACKSCWVSTYDRIPGALFEGARQRCTIVVYTPSLKTELYTTAMMRWKSEAFQNLFSNLYYAQMICVDYDKWGIPKVPKDVLEIYRVLEGVRLAESFMFAKQKTKIGSNVFIGSTAANFISESQVIPPSVEVETMRVIAASGPFAFKVQDMDVANVAVAALSGDLFFLYWLIRSDGFHVTSKLVSEYLAQVATLPETSLRLLARIGRDLSMLKYDALVFKKNAGVYVGSFDYRKLPAYTRRADLLLLSGLGVSFDRVLQLFDYIQRVRAVNVHTGEKNIPSEVRKVVFKKTKLQKTDLFDLSVIDEYLTPCYSMLIPLSSK